MTSKVEEQLQAMSPSTVERLLRKNRSRKGRLPQKGPHRANQATKGVPMGRSQDTRKTDLVLRDDLSDNDAHFRLDIVEPQV